ncbi:MAG: DNA-methyltransferase [Mycobacteriales bacterium]
MNPQLPTTTNTQPGHAQPAHDAAVVGTGSDTTGHPPAPCYTADGVTLYRGDAIAVLRELPTDSAGAVLTDPPYCSGGTTSADRTSKSTRRKYVSADAAHDLPDFAGDQRDQRSFTYWCTLWLTECHRLTAVGGVCMVFVDWRQLPAMTDAIQAAGWTWRGIIAWHKPGARPQQGRFTNSCEYIIWASKGPLPREGKCLPGMYSYPAPHHTTRIHITEKPVELLRRLTRIVPPNRVIVDPFAGSGATAEAALAEHRRFVGIEISAHYTDRITHRLRTAAATAGSGDGCGDAP